MQQSDVLHVEVVPPEKVFFSGELSQVITRLMEGGDFRYRVHFF